MINDEITFCLLLSSTSQIFQIKHILFHNKENIRIDKQNGPKFQNLIKILSFGKKEFNDNWNLGVGDVPCCFS